MSALERLADRCGIQHVSEDAFGKEHVTSPETKRALLKAMHIAAETEEQAQSSLEAIEAAEWSRTLPPVVVAYSHGKPLGVPIHFDQGTATVHWTVYREDGGTAEGTIAFGELELLQTRNEPEPLERRLLLLPSDLPWGYHRLTVGTPAECSLIVSPGTCFVPESATNHQRLWGVAAQLYLLRSSHNWGIGDFTDLRELVEAVRRNGGDAVGINPVHALFPDHPEEASPYSPSDRLLLNVLYIDPQTLPEMETCTEAKALIESADFQRRLAACKAAQLVDYDAVADLKLPVLKLLFAEFERQKNAERFVAFKAFVDGRKPLLERACLFQAVRSFFTEESPECGNCKQWRAQFRSSGSPELDAFAREHRDRVRFQLWMQWVADEQLRAASVAAEV